MIGQQLITIAENSDKIYKAGYAAGYEAGGGGGGIIPQEDLWDTLQKKGQQTNYYYGFAGKLWNDTTFHPKYSVIPTVCSYMFAHSEITDLTACFSESVQLDFGKIENNSSAIRPFDNSAITHIGRVDLRGVTNQLNTFFARSSSGSPLTTIDELVVSATNKFGASFFQNQDSLTNIIIEGKIANDFSIAPCPLLPVSIESIITALEDFTKEEEPTKILTVNETVYNYIIAKYDHTIVGEADEQTTILSAKNWILAKG